jgi:hypothetical protein
MIRDKAAGSLPPSNIFRFLRPQIFGWKTRDHHGANRTFGRVLGNSCCRKVSGVESLMCLVPGLLPLLTQLISASDFCLSFLDNFVSQLCALPPAITHILRRYQTAFGD